MSAPASRWFVVTNWFRWVIEARDAGYSEADIRFVLRTLKLLEPMQKILEAADG